MEEKNAFGKFIMSKRKEAGLTQHELADRLYFTESAVSKWERGLSYPDITLVLPICNELNISEHELITSSEDHKQRTLEKQAKNYKTIYTTYNMFFLISYAIAIVTCFICNLAVNHTLSWFFIVLTSIMTAASLTTLPVFVKNHKSFITLISFLFSLNLLLLTCMLMYGNMKWYAISSVSILFGLSIVFLPFVLKMVPARNVFSKHKALISMLVDTVLLFATVIVALACIDRLDKYMPEVIYLLLIEITFPWLLLVIVRYSKINSFFKAGICIICAGLYYFVQNPIIDNLLLGKDIDFFKIDLNKWNAYYANGNSALIVLLTCLLVGIVFIFAGIMKQYKESTSK